MADIDFNSKVSSNDPTRESEAERAVKDQQKAEQKTAGFRQAMQRSAPGAANLPPPPAAAQAAVKQANVAGAPGVKAPEGAAMQQAQAKTAADAGGGAAMAASAGAPSGQIMQAMSAKSAPAGDGAGGASAASGALAGSVGGEGGGETTSTTMRAAGGTSGASGTSGAGGSGGEAGGAGGSAAPIAASQAAQQHADAQTGGDSGQNPEKQSLAALNRDASGRDGAVKDKQSSRSEAPTSRIDLASIVPSFPMPAAPLQAAAAPQQLRPVFNAETIQRIVEYALVTQNAQGQSEFHLGLSGATLGGIGVHLTACGRRRVRLRFTGVGDSDAISEEDVSALIESLRAKNVEVADVVME